MIPSVESGTINTMQPGTQLSPDRGILSENGNYWAAMTLDGNFHVIHKENGIWIQTWQSNTHVAGSYVVMQEDGNLVVYAPGNKAVWATGTDKRCTGGSMANPAPKSCQNNPNSYLTM